MFHGCLWSISANLPASPTNRFPRLYLNHFKWVPAIVFNNHTVWISGETMGEEGGEGERRNDPSKLPAEKSFPSPLLFWNDTQTLNNCLRAVRGQHNYWLPFSFVLFAFPTFPSPFLFLFLFIFFFFFFWIIISSLLFERQSTLLLTTELHVPCLHQKGMRGCTLLTTTTTMMTMITITADWQTVHQQTETDSVLVNY